MTEDLRKLYFTLGQYKSKVGTAIFDDELSTSFPGKGKRPGNEVG